MPFLVVVCNIDKLEHQMFLHEFGCCAKQAANYLHIKNLLDLTCQTVADMIKGKTPEEIRKTFNIKNDFTPEEEEEVRRENQWAFE
jgi:hypothetical protein